MSFLVSKQDGTSERFDSKKLLHSLEKAGAAHDVAESIVKAIEAEFSGRDNGVVSTHEIYSRAFSNLRAHKRPVAARYSLKKAVLDFGPSGFPFESYLAQLFMHDGYEAKTDQIVKGGCTEHEVDIVLTKDTDGKKETIFVEVKFHNSPVFKSDLKVALYVKARIDDLIAGGHTGARGMLVTNTKFTDRAIEYAECNLLELLSWDYPQRHTLHERIEAAKLYPVTALTSLSRREKTALLEAKIVLCSQLISNTEALASIGVAGHKAQVILEEAGALCSS